MKSKYANRELPCLKVHNTEHFNLCSIFYENTTVFPLNVRVHNSNNGSRKNTIIFEVMDNNDYIRSISGISELKKIFNEYNIVIIKESEST